MLQTDQNMSDPEESKRSRHGLHMSRTFDEVMKLGEISDTAGSGCSSGSNGWEEDSEWSGREKRNVRIRDILPHTFTPAPPSVAGQGDSGMEDVLERLLCLEETDWHFPLLMDTPAEWDIHRTDNRLDESTDRQKDVCNNLLTDGQADEERTFIQGESSLDGAVPNHSEGGGESPNHKKQRSVYDGPAYKEHTNPSISPLMNIKDEHMNIKDEPIDKGYDCALLPQSSIKQIKEELEAQEDELRVSSVYSVRGGNSYVFQPQATKPPSGGANPASVRCSGCSKILVKGQTAYQRKGSTQLLCSTVCLTGFLPNTVLGKTCHQCLKDIQNPMYQISILVDNTLKDICSQFCLAVFNCRKKDVFMEHPSCSICKRTNKVQHEVTCQGSVHRLCSDSCFSTWRHYRQLATNCCKSCGIYCNSKGGRSQVLTIGDVTMSFCGFSCIGTYKQTCSSMMDCAHCKNKAVVSSMLLSDDRQGKVKLYCSSDCVNCNRPAHVLTGNPLPCTHCKVKAVPQYHLAMADRRIQNFCSYDCLTTFRSKALVQGSGPPPGQMNEDWGLRPKQENEGEAMLPHDADGEGILMITSDRVRKRPQKWESKEIAAVEKHMMYYIESRRVPGKSDCDRCLKLEPKVLKTRNWYSIKSYIRNRITDRKRKV